MESNPGEIELEALRRRALRNEKSAPRKHHIVPKSYLRRWCSADLVRVTDVVSGNTYKTSYRKAGRVTDFYRVEAEDIDPDEIPPLFFETLLSDVEGWGKRGIDELLAMPEELDAEVIARFARFLGLQFTRGATQRRELRFAANELFKMRYENVSDEGIAHLISRSGQHPSPEAIRDARDFLNRLRDGSFVVAPQDAALVGIAADSAEEVGKCFLERQWIVLRTPPFLITCDEPVIPVGGPGLPREERAGVATAGVVLFPLTSDRLLVMMREDLAELHGLPPMLDGRVVWADLDHAETVEVCREIAMNADRWTFERPDRQIARRFEIPHLPKAAALEKVASIEQDGGEEIVLRSYRVSRWAHRTGPRPWPVSWWWHPQWAGRRPSVRSVIPFD